MAPEAEDQFRLRVTSLFQALVTLGERINKETETQLDKRPLINWAVLFAKPGPWQSVRGMQLWSRKPGAEDSPPDIAMDHGLTSQVNGFADLSLMGRKRFTRLAVLYKIGSETETRVKGKRVIRLDEKFVEELLAGPPDIPPEESENAFPIHFPDTYPDGYPDCENREHFEKQSYPDSENRDSDRESNRERLSDDTEPF